jgi:hypothetical protein
MVTMKLPCPSRRSVNLVLVNDIGRMKVHRRADRIMLLRRLNNTKDEGKFRAKLKPESENNGNF